MTKTSIRIKLSNEEKKELERIVRQQTAPHRLVVRAKMILLLAAKKSFAEVARRVGVARRIVYKWAKRFIKRRLAGLQDLPRPGRPARFSPDRGNVSGQAGLRASRQRRSVSVPVDLCRVGTNPCS